MIMKTHLTTAALFATALAASAHAGSQDFTDLDLDSLTHGTIVTNQFAGQGVTVSTVNLGGGPSDAVIFNSDLTGTRDSDLEVELGNLLIIQENGTPNNGVYANPDDEASSPAGVITFDFDAPIVCFEFDLVDYQDTFYSSIQFFEVGSGDLVEFEFSDFATTTADAGVTSDILFDMDALGLTDGVNRVVFNFGESQAISGIRYAVVPTPTAAAAGVLGLAGLMWRRRRVA